MQQTETNDLGKSLYSLMSILLSSSELERHGGGISQKGNEKHSFALPKSLGFIYPRESFMLSQSKKHWVAKWGYRLCSSTSFQKLS
jgi:hypothetical protein